MYFFIRKVKLICETYKLVDNELVHTFYIEFAY